MNKYSVGVAGGGEDMRLRRRRVLFAFYVSFLGLILGLAFLSSLWVWDVHPAIKFLGFVFGAGYYLSAFMVWVNKYGGLQQKDKT